MNTQQAPFPDELAELVTALAFRPGWVFELAHMDRGQGSIGLTLDIQVTGYNGYHPERGPTYGPVHHLMPVPPAAFNRQSWQRWLLDQCLIVDRHEACEFFVVDGEHPYPPQHGPGNDPYIIFDHGTDLDARTAFTGTVKE